MTKKISELTSVTSLADSDRFEVVASGASKSATASQIKTYMSSEFIANNAGTVALGAANITMTGSIAATGARVTKGWFTDIEITNAPTIGGVAATGTGGIVLAASPALTGSPTAPTQTAGDNSTKIATTAYVDASITAFAGVKVTKSASQSISNATNTVLTWDQETYDTGSAHDNVTNNSRITIPAAWNGKKVRFEMQIRWPTNSTGIRNAGIYKNGAAPTTGGRCNISVAPATNSSVHMYGTYIDTVATGDYYEVNVYQSSGGALNVENTGSDSWFSATVLG